MKKVFLDSSVILESLKGNTSAQQILEHIFPYSIYFNAIVYTEVSFHLLKFQSRKSPFTLKKQKLVSDTAKEIVSILADIFDIAQNLCINESIYELSQEYMVKYNLLPNDAIILATCKHYGIKYLATLDKDFKEAAEKENVEVISDVS